MELNALLFPAPPVKYSVEDLEGEILYIPRFYRFNKQHQLNMEKLDKRKKNLRKQAQNISVHTDSLNFKNVVNNAKHGLEKPE